jgi:hypothetical protein
MISDPNVLLSQPLEPFPSTQAITLHPWTLQTTSNLSPPSNDSIREAPVSQTETEIGEPKAEMSGTLEPGDQHYGKNGRGGGTREGSRAERTWERVKGWCRKVFLEGGVERRDEQRRGAGG